MVATPKRSNWEKIRLRKDPIEKRSDWEKIRLRKDSIEKRSNWEKIQLRIASIETSLDWEKTRMGNAEIEWHEDWNQTEHIMMKVILVKMGKSRWSKQWINYKKKGIQGIRAVNFWWMGSVSGNMVDSPIALLLGHWYEIMALYYVKSILTEISASRQDRRVLQKSKIIRIEFLSKWGMLQTSRYV